MVLRVLYVTTAGTVVLKQMKSLVNCTVIIWLKRLGENSQVDGKEGQRDSKLAEGERTAVVDVRFWRRQEDHPYKPTLTVNLNYGIYSRPNYT